MITTSIFQLIHKTAHYYTLITKTASDCI